MSDFSSQLARLEAQLELVPRRMEDAFKLMEGLSRDINKMRTDGAVTDTNTRIHKEHIDNIYERIRSVDFSLAEIRTDVALLGNEMKSIREKTESMSSRMSGNENRMLSFGFEILKWCVSVG